MKMELPKPQYRILPKDTPFTIIRETGTEKTKARQAVTIKILQRAMGQTFFTLGNLTCRTSAIICLLFMIGCQDPGFAQDKCQDPGLKPELQKACYQMEKICAEVGCKVSVR